MKPVPITVYSDYVCPWCYMACASLEQVKQEVPLDIEWRAFELHPVEIRRQGDEAAMEEKRKMIAAMWPRVKRIAAERYGLDIEQGPFGIDTRLAHIAAKAARDMGAGDDFHLRVFERYWKKGDDIGRREVLLEIAASLDLDLDLFAERLDDVELLDEVLSDEGDASAIGVQGVPAMVIGQKYLVSGAQTKDVLVRALKEYQATGSIGESR